MSTLHSRYQRKLADFQERKRRGEDKERVDQQEIEYILDTIPFIKEYEEEGPAPVEPQDFCDHRRFRKKYKSNKKVKVKDQGNKTLTGFVEVTSCDNKKDVLSRYILHVEQETVDEVDLDTQDDQEFVCQACKVPLVIDNTQSQTICPECGVCRTYTGLSRMNLSYTEEVNLQSVNSFSYKRINHFVEWLNSIQAKETTEISDEVVDAVREEFRKTRVKSSTQITPAKVRQFLKKLHLQKLYDHSNAICMRIKGQSAPTFTPELEQQLKHMFFQVQAPFEAAIANTKRKNFLSYSYCLYKFFQLLGHGELLEYCSLLKDRLKLFQQDKIFKSICEQLGWPFYPSV